ncbi:MAG: TOBE domain-containing protein, partial [Gammaproteobacteria bacterium]
REGSDDFAIDFNGAFRLPVPPARRAAYSALVDRPVELGLRPENLSVGHGEGKDVGHFEATIDVVEPMGSDALAFFQLADVEITAKCDPHNSPRPNKKTTLAAEMSKMHLIDPHDGRVVPLQ